MKEKIEAIITELENYDSLSEIKNLKKLSGHKTYNKIRIGDFRIGLEYKSNQITLVEILHRKDIYKKFP